MSSCDSAERILAALVPVAGGTSGRKLWDVSLCEWDNRLKASNVESLYAVDQASAECLDTVRMALDDFKNADGSGLISVLLSKDRTRSDLLRSFLSLGLHPDLPHKDGARPSHVVSKTYMSRLDWKSERVGDLSLVRPDLTKRNKLGLTPLEAAEDKLKCLPGDDNGGKKYFEDIRDIWLECMTHGVPCLAQLAHDGKWFAVKNLCRRRAVSVEEIRLTYEGKDVVEWAQCRGEDLLAEEIRHLYSSAMETSAAPTAEAGFGDQTTYRVTMIDAATQWSSLEAEVSDLAATLDARRASVEHQVVHLLEEVDAIGTLVGNRLLEVPREGDGEDTGETEIRVQGAGCSESSAGEAGDVDLESFVEPVDETVAEGEHGVVDDSISDDAELSEEDEIPPVRPGLVSREGGFEYWIKFMKQMGHS